MKTEAWELSLLFDCYSTVLTEKQRTCFELYYNQDFSLSEIAQQTGVSRQGVHDTLVRTESALRTMEAQLGCLRRQKALQKAAADLQALQTALSVQQLPALALQAQGILDLLEKE